MNIRVITTSTISSDIDLVLFESIVANKRPHCSCASKTVDRIVINENLHKLCFSYCEQCYDLLCYYLKEDDKRDTKRNELSNTSKNKVPSKGNEMSKKEYCIHWIENLICPIFKQRYNFPDWIAGFENRYNEKELEAMQASWNKG